jgi:hypothetical protein
MRLFLGKTPKNQFFVAPSSARERQMIDILPPAKSRVTMAPPMPPKVKRRGMRVAALLLIVTTFVFGAGQMIARASFIALYPNECAGEWRNLTNAAGTTDMTEATDASLFAEDNSAVLDANAKGDIMCDHFAVPDPQGKILRAKLHLAWTFKDGVVAPTADPITPAPTETDPVVPTDVSPSDPSSTETPAPTIDVPADPASDTAPVPTPIEESAPQAWLRNIIPYAHAAGPDITASLVFNGIKDFLTIEYSIAGGPWQSIDNAGLEIPVRSWSDINAMKVRIHRLPTDIANAPTVYLGGMWLEAKYVEGDGSGVELGWSSDQAQPDPEPMTLTETAVDLMSEIPGAIQDLVTDDTPTVAIDSEGDASASGNNQASAAEEYLPPDVPPHPDFTFSLGKTLPVELPKTVSPLTALVSGAIDTSKTSSDVSVHAEMLGQGLTLEGSCSKQYFVVLVFADPDDYRTDPSRAVFNRALPCQDGRYSYTMHSDDLPGSLSDATYYLMAGEQDDETEWTLTPFVYPFALGRR